jgi:Cyclin, N-terminal domain
MRQHYSTNTLDAMLAQETAYLASDYLGTTTRTPSSSVAVDADCRAKMAGWCDQCVDFCKFDREVVEITLNYLDRFASTPPVGHSILEDRGEFQLAAMAAMYMAIKVHQAEAVSSKSISALSRGRYGKDDIEAMEVRMITALQWRMNPVTVSAFVRAILDQIPTDSSCRIDTKAVYVLAKIQTDAAVRDYTFCTIRPSVIAYSAILNAVEAIINAAHDSSTTNPIYGFLQTFLEQRLLLTLHDIVGIQKYLYASIANTSRPVSQNPPPPSASRRRPPTPVADDDDDDSDEQQEQEQPSSSSSSFKKVRRINNSTGDSPRSSAVQHVVPPHC